MLRYRDKFYANYVSSGQAKRDIYSTNPDIAYKIARPFVKNVISKHIPFNQSIEILDLACGSGVYLYYLQKAGFQNVFGVDVSQEQVSLAKKLGVNNIICSDIFSFISTTNKKYDVVLLMDIIEHLTKDELVDLLEGVNKIMNIDGKLIIHVPNAEGIFGMRVMYADFTHENCFTPFGIKQLLTICDFKDTKSFEDKPVIHSLIAAGRRLLWICGTFFTRILFFAETAKIDAILTQNMTVTCFKK